MGVTMKPQDGSARLETWAQVDEGFHVGSRAGEFLGYVDRSSPTDYRAFDMTSRPTGSFVDLSKAIQAVNDQGRTGADT